MILEILIISIILSTGFNRFFITEAHSKEIYFMNKNSIEKSLYNWKNLIKAASYKYKVDEKLIKSIIYTESSGNPYAQSTSHAIGLMQIKPSSAGLEVYRLYGKKGQPSVKDLYNPKTNINIGTTYISILERNFIGIKNKDVMRYATIVSYANGTSALLKIFSKNKKTAIAIINTMTAKSFCIYVKKNIQRSKHFLI